MILNKNSHNRFLAIRGHRLRLVLVYPYCHGCCIELTDRTATVDHHIPISAGGTDAPSNIVIMCSKCNSIKGGNLDQWELFNRRSANRRKRFRKSGKIPLLPNEIKDLYGSG